LDTDPPKEDFIQKLGLIEIFRAGRVYIYKL